MAAGGCCAGFRQGELCSVRADCMMYNAGVRLLTGGKCEAEYTCSGRHSRSILIKTDSSIPFESAHMVNPSSAFEIEFASLSGLSIEDRSQGHPGRLNLSTSK